MRGILHKTEEGWKIKYVAKDLITERWIIEDLILHPDNEKNPDDLQEGKEVDFINYEKWEQVDGETKVTKYAKIKEPYTPYCPFCDACGEEGCCSPMMCKQHPNGHYCELYLKDLKFGYKMYHQIMEMLEDNQEKNKEILESIQKIFDDTYDKIY